MALDDDPYFLPPTLVLWQFCETSGHSICFTTQSLPHHYCSAFNDKDSSSSTYSVRSCDKDVRDVEECCRILPVSQKYIVSHDTTHHRTFVSSSTPPLKDYTRVYEGVQRSYHEHCAANDIVLLSNNRGSFKSTVIARFFHIKDIESRGQVRKWVLMMVLSERFAAIDYIPDLQDKFGEIIKFVVEKSEVSYELDSKNRDYRYHNTGTLRAPGLLLKFDDLHNFLHERFTLLHNNLETKYQPIVIVPPGKVDELSRLPPTWCFCSPQQANSTMALTRDRAQTLVELPSPKFSELDEIKEVSVLKHFEELVRQIVCGNQIVLRGQHSHTIDSILTLLSSLLPTNCARNKGYTSQYEPGYTYNFIGIPPGITIPDSDDILVVDVTATIEHPSTYKHFTVAIRAPPNTFRSYIAVPSIVDELVYLVTISRTQKPETFLKCLAAILKKWSCKAVNYYLATRTMMDPKEETSLLDIFQVRRKDVPVLTFFVRSLKPHEKTSLLKEVQ